jgi:dihydropteroate synthase
MGILNVTPDSFYDGGMYHSEKDLLMHVDKMINEGATIIDIGAISTKPGAEEISEEQELEKLLQTLNLIVNHFPDTIISVDTYRSKIAKSVLENGAHIINDISGGTFDNNMFSVIAEYNSPYIMMHIQGTPKDMQKNPQYKNVVAEIKLFFEQQLSKLNKLGITKNIILDPGFGFGKTLEHNYKLLKHLKSFEDLGYPILAGVSRKSMINKVLKSNPQKALNGTTVLNTIALINAANILRVHDVKEAMEAINLVEFFKQTNND